MAGGARKIWPYSQPLHRILLSSKFKIFGIQEKNLKKYNKITREKWKFLCGQNKADMKKNCTKLYLLEPTERKLQRNNIHLFLNIFILKN